MTSNAKKRPLGLVFGITNQKGGVAKSTTSINTSSALTKMGYKVLVGDIDPQGDASDGMGVDVEDAEATIYEVLKGEADIHDAIVETEMGDVLVGSGDLAAAEYEFQQLGKEQMLKKAVAGLRDEYDFILLDTPPSLGWCTINVMTASDYVIIPSRPAKWSNKALVTLNKTLDMVREFTNPDLQVAGIIISDLDERTNSAKTNKQTADIIGNKLGYPVFETKIRKATKVEDSQTDGFDLIDTFPDCKPALDYVAFAEELVRSYGKVVKNG